MAKKQEEQLFVGISGGNELRRSMLECSKGVLEALKEHENFKKLREEKVKLVHQLKGEVKEAYRMISSLRGCLPKVKETGIKKIEINKAKEDKPKAIKVEKPKAQTELEKLEAELADIENKLNSLS